ncbi:Aste57867_10126 [Aphanomyces stellatus]|uniref:Transmembrane protein 198 n=1 Tax=Aphanomyces stellatus TaxID=120398 RepID=A0A485KPL6_9STRA|nr:hypothetical protein As57867_010087 [Aphanomyces stellatus]VFT87002.1 Aste57867_10126 [Aphanomyces stellatus]
MRPNKCIAPLLTSTWLVLALVLAMQLHPHAPLPRSLTGVVAMCVGFSLAFLGHRLVRPATILSGFALGAVLGYVVVDDSRSDAPSSSTTSHWLAFALGGATFAVAAGCVHRLGVSFLGLFTGALVASQFQASLGYVIAPANTDVVFVVLVIVCGAAATALALARTAAFDTPATACAGAILAIYGVGQLLGGYPTAVVTLHKLLVGDRTSQPVAPAWWGYLAATILLASAGVLAQRHAQRPRHQAAALKATCVVVGEDDDVCWSPSWHPVESNRSDTSVA